MRLFLRLAFLTTSSLLGLTVASMWPASCRPRHASMAPPVSTAVAPVVDRPQRLASTESVLEQPVLDDGRSQPSTTAPYHATMAAQTRPRVAQRFVPAANNASGHPGAGAARTTLAGAVPQASPSLEGLSGLGDPGKLDQGISLLRSMAKDNPDMLKQLLGDKVDPAMLDGIQKLLAGQVPDAAPVPLGRKPGPARSSAGTG